MYAATFNADVGILQIDPATLDVVSVIPVSGTFADVAYDPVNEGFWLVEAFESSASFYLMDGTSTGETLAGGGEGYGLMGIAYDDVSPDGPYLWMAYGSSEAYNVASLGRWHIETGVFTANIFDLKTIPGALSSGISAGGIYIYEDAVSGKYILSGIIQGGTLVYGLDLAEIQPAP